MQKIWNIKIQDYNFLIKKIWKIWRKLLTLNRTVIHYAIKRNLNEIIGLLISKGADINAIDCNKQISIIIFWLKAFKIKKED